MPKTFYDKWALCIVLVTLLLFPFACYLAGRAVQSNVNRVEDWLPKSFDETKNLAWFRKHFATDQFIIVSWNGCQLGFESDSTKDDPRLELLERMIDPNSQYDRPDITSSDGSLSEADIALRQRYFKSVVTGRHMLNQLTSAPLSLSVETAVKRLQGSMIGPDGRQTCLVVTLHSQALGELKQVLGTGQWRIFRKNVPPGILRRLIEQAGIPAADVHLGGPPVDNSAIDEEGERTLVRLAGLSGLLGLVLAWWSLRSIPLTFIVFFCGVMSAATSLAIVPLAGQNVDAILMSMPSLVYVLAISGAVHLVNYFREAVQANGIHGAAERAVSHAWKPALLCSVTTAVGLLSLAASELVPIRKFGIFSAAGVMSLVFIVYFFLPAALRLSNIGKKWVLGSDLQDTSRGAATNSIFIWEQIATFIVKHYRVVGIGCLIITSVIGLGLVNSRSSIDLLKLFDHRARILQDYHWLEKNLGNLVPLEIVVRFPLPTQREMNADEDAINDWQALSFIQRLETVTRIQAFIDKRFGHRGEDLVGRSLSAASFTPSLPSANSGTLNFIQRKTLDATLSKSKQELSDAGFLKTDTDDGSELWRISLRVAAFRDVDYGKFVQDLEEITQPLLEAYQTRVMVLTELEHVIPKDPAVGRRVLLWSHCENSDTHRMTHDTTQTILHRLLQEYRCNVQLLESDPATTPLDKIESFDALDAVVVFGDFNDTDTEVIRMSAPKMIDARTSGHLGGKRIAPSATQAQLSAVYTGVVPIVYQAQRALLDSLVESTWWSFLTITPIMMLVSRSVLAGAIAMIPNAIPVLLIFGGMGWLGIPIDIGSMMTASIALGVAVDDTIHFLARYREDLEHSSSRNAAIISTYSHCAVPTLQAALISGLGLSVFALSTFTPTQKFGWLMLCILLAGVVAELILLPAILASSLGNAFERRAHQSNLMKFLWRVFRLDLALRSLRSQRRQPRKESSRAA